MSDPKRASQGLKPGRGPAGGRGPLGGRHGMGMPVEKPRNFKGTLIRFIRYLAPYKVNLLIVFIFAIASTIFTIGAPQVIRQAMNNMQDGFMARMVLKQLSAVQLQVAGRLKQLPLIQSGNQSSTPESAQPPGMTPEVMTALRQLLQLPLLDTVEGNEQKADVCRQLVAALKPLSAFQGLLPEGMESSGTQQGISLTTAQIGAAIEAVAKTGGKIDLKSIGIIILILIGMYLLSSLFQLIMQLVMVKVSQNTVYKLRREVDHKLTRLPLKFFDTRTHGEILSRVTNDIDTISTTLQQSLTQIITSVVTILGYFIMMLTISPILTLIMLATLPLYMASTMFVVKRSQKYFAAQQKELGELSGHVEEMYTGHKIVKAFGNEKRSVEKFSRINDKLYTAGWKAQFVSGIMFPLMNFISNVGYVGICVVGGLWITKSLLKVGDITAFIQYSRSFTMPIMQTANIANILQSTIACAERVFEVLDEQAEQADNPAAQPLPAPRGDVVFRNVDFRYKADTPLIENLNLEVKSGHTIAIVGPTGAGKTTLVNLLMRFYEIDKGAILVENHDIRELKRVELRSLLGMVLQDTWLFNGTIRDNIAYGRAGASEEEVVAAAKMAYADHFIRTLPEGYDTVLNEEATNISQGQKQLLTIARAILSDPVILILDEATSNVDTRTEVLIQKAMLALMKNRTSFVIAHRLSTIRDAALILVMNEGKIIEQGNHKQLLARDGFYADLYNSQFTGGVLKNKGSI